MITRPRLRTCWHASDLSDAVLFHGRYNHPFMPHSHDALTFILVTGGAVEIEIDEERYEVGKGQFVMIGAHQIHAARPLDRSGWKMRSLHLRPETLAAVCGLSAAEVGNLRFLRPVHSARTPAGALFFDVHYCSQVGGPAGDRGQRFREFLEWIARNLDMLAPQPRRTPASDDRLEKARKILSETMFENVSLQRLGREVGMSPFALIRHFKKEFGISPHAWRLQKRADEAARLLRAGVGLAETAARCGFADQPHMARVFKKVFGVTPGQYGAMLKHDYLH